MLEQDVLLATKILVPQLSTELIERPHLMMRINAALQSTLTLLSAPVGAGKTVLLSEWASHSKFPVAWLSLDEHDNDVVRFLSYMIASVQTIHSGFGTHILSMLWTPTPPSVEELLTLFVNEVMKLPAKIVLILDDYHTITAQPVHDVLIFLVDHIPTRLRLVVLSRVDPPLPLARWRAKGLLKKLHTSDLRFSEGEATHFLNTIMVLHLSREDIVLLHERTEGWIAGLYLAALALREHSDVSSFIAKFHGNHRYILDYLVEEVFERQPEHIQNFLLQTALLDRLSGQLCDVVTESHDSQALLVELERNNLFLIPLDNQRKWYRYHQLFADVLRERLLHVYPEQISTFYRRAAHWCMENKQPVTAVEYALAGGDIAQSIAAIEQVARDMLMRNEVITLLRWLYALPSDEIGGHAYLSLYYAWASFHVGNLKIAKICLGDLERLMQSKSELASDQRLYSEVTVLQARIAVFQGDSERCIALSQQALVHLPPDDLLLRGELLLNLGFAYGELEKFDLASETFIAAINVNEEAGNYRAAMFSVRFLALLQARLGQLHRAAETYTQAIERAELWGGFYPPMGYIYIGLGELFYQWNDLEAATEHLRRGIDYGQKGGDLKIWAVGSVMIAYVLQAQREESEARKLLKKVEKQVATFSYEEAKTWIAVHRALLSWRQDAYYEEAFNWAKTSGFALDDTVTRANEYIYLVLVRIIGIWQSTMDDAIELLRMLLARARASKRISSVIEILIILALIYQKYDAPFLAKTTLEEALLLAEPEGYIRIFVDEGDILAMLLQEIYEMSPHVVRAYVRKLLKAFGRHIAFVVKPQLYVELKDEDEEQKEPVYVSEYARLLSKSEQEVLQRIAEGKSNPQIAEELVISLNTVKSHVKKIYATLDVHNRVEAVTRAKELDIL